jgi:hypothetical protein
MAQLSGTRQSPLLAHPPIVLGWMHSDVTTHGIGKLVVDLWGAGECTHVLRVCVQHRVCDARMRGEVGGGGRGNPLHCCSLSAHQVWAGRAANGKRQTQTTALPLTISTMRCDDGGCTSARPPCVRLAKHANHTDTNQVMFACGFCGVKWGFQQSSHHAHNQSSVAHDERTHRAHQQCASALHIGAWCKGAVVALLQRWQCWGQWHPPAREGRAPAKTRFKDVVFLIQKSVVTSDEQMIGRKMIGSHDVTVLTGSCADGAAFLVRK